MAHLCRSLLDVVAENGVQTKESSRIIETEGSRCVGADRQERQDRRGCSQEGSEGGIEEREEFAR